MNQHLLRAGSTGAVLAVALTVSATSFTSNASTPDAEGKVAIVHAVPKLALNVAIDGEPVRKDMASGTVVGPIDLAEGNHEVTFSDGTEEISSTVAVTAGEASDVVVHRPAAVGGAPVVSVYPTPDDPIDPGKARVLLAHTATVPPADVVVDGQTVFTNIANGEFAQADVAAGAHEVSLLPAGVTGRPILGPLDVDLEAGTITAVYAVGTPRDGSMNVIVRTTEGTASDVEPPNEIDTGSAGLVGGVQVWTFSGG